MSQYILDRGRGSAAGCLWRGRGGGEGQQEGVLGRQGRIERAEIHHLGQDVRGQPADQVHERAEVFIVDFCH